MNIIFYIQKEQIQVFCVKFLSITLLTKPIIPPIKKNKYKNLIVETYIIEDKIELNFTGYIMLTK